MHIFSERAGERETFRHTPNSGKLLKVTTVNLILMELDTGGTHKKVLSRYQFPKK